MKGTILTITAVGAAFFGIVDALFECPLAGSIIETIDSEFNYSSNLRSWEFTCRNFDQRALDTCTSVAPDSQGPHSWNISCPDPETQYVRGITRWWNTRNGGFYSFRFHCCSTHLKRIVPETCIERTLFQSGESRNVKINGAIVSISTVWDNELRDRTWKLETCSFEDEIDLTVAAYEKFPSWKENKFGDYRQSCKRGEVVTRLDSVWGYQNYDRAMFITCGTPILESKVDCNTLQYRWPEGVMEDPLPPKSWMIEGCGRQEALMEIKSETIRGVRRYIFGCCSLWNQTLLDESTCEYHRVSKYGTADWSLKIGTHHVIRGISAQYSRSQNDRINVYLEVCSFEGFKAEVPNVTYSCPDNLLVTGMKNVQELGKIEARVIDLFCDKLDNQSSGKDSEVDCIQVYPEFNEASKRQQALCPEQHGMAGIEWSQNIGYSVKCCRKKSMKLISNSCYMESSTKGVLNLDTVPGTVYAGIEYEEDILEQFGVYWRKYGEFSFKKNCAPGSVVTRIDSVFGRHNRDRGLHLTCGRRGAHPLSGRRIDYVYPEGKPGLTTDAMFWDRTGCDSQQVLFDIASWFGEKENSRRYKFGCRNLFDYPIDEHSCYWKSSASEYRTDFVFEVPEDEIIRGIRSTYHPYLGDRKFDFELCRLREKYQRQSRVSGNKCSVQLQGVTPARAKALSFDYSYQHSYSDCASRCQDNSQCHSVRYNGKGDCHLTPVKPEISCRKRKFLTKIEPLGRDEEVWIYCFKCGHSISPA